MNRVQLPAPRGHRYRATAGGGQVLVNHRLQVWINSWTSRGKSLFVGALMWFFVIQIIGGILHAARVL